MSNEILSSIYNFKQLKIALIGLLALRRVVIKRKLRECNIWKSCKRILMAVNQHGVVFTLREVAKHMVARAETGDAGGSMILCGSGSIFQGVPMLTHYGAAKGALAALSKGLAAELGPHGIRCNVIAPGFIITEMTMADPEYGQMLADAVAAKAGFKTDDVVSMPANNLTLVFQRG